MNLTFEIPLNYFESLLGNFDNGCSIQIVEFEPDVWAPGVWCGTEGLILRKKWIITSVDLEHRRISMERL